MAIDSFALPQAKRVLRNPSATDLQALAAAMPNARQTESAT